MKLGVLLASTPSIDTLTSAQYHTYFHDPMARTILTTASHLSGQLVELAVAAKVTELATATAPRSIFITTNIEAGTISILATIPILLAGTGGEVTLAAAEFLPRLDINAHHLSLAFKGQTLTVDGINLLFFD
ncbi:MAG: hypothetical protein F6K19_46565 [Cyanothece sp. SIO1E1]|nr:hypothetical protein [Cyanothece sp. SIO1E1]